MNADQQGRMGNRPSSETNREECPGTAAGVTAGETEIKQMDDATKKRHDDFIRENYRHLSAQEIGDTLGRSRNSIIGRAQRLGMAKKKEWSPTQRKPPQRPGQISPRARSTNLAIQRQKIKRIAKEARATVTLPAEIKPPSRETNCTIMELTNKTCRWPHGDSRSKDFVFCGSLDGVNNPSEPYCRYHQKFRKQHPGVSHGTT